MRIRDLDFGLTYVYRYDRETDAFDFYAFNDYNDAIDFMALDSEKMNGLEPGENVRYIYGYVDGNREVKEVVANEIIL